jgi:hypothetical protein
MNRYRTQKTIRHNCALSASSMAPSFYPRSTDAEPGFSAATL